MDRFEPYVDHSEMIVPYTFAFPMMRMRGLPREFASPGTRQKLIDSISMASFPDYIGPTM